MAQLARRAAALALALLLVGAPVSPVSAAPAATPDEIAEWCEADPALVVPTPAGRVVVLYVTNYGLGLEHLAAVQKAEVSLTTRPVGGGSEPAPPAEVLLVEVVVVIPLDADGQPFPTRSAVSTGPHATGTVLATASGQSGGAMRMEFRLDVP